MKTKMKKAIFTGILLLGIQSFVKADEQSYAFSVSSSVLPLLKLTPQVQEIKNKTSSFGVFTTRQIDAAGINSVTSPAMIQALYVKGNDILNLQLDAMISSETLTTHHSIADIDHIWNQWIQNIGRSPQLKAYSPSLKKNTFIESRGFVSEMQMKKDDATYNFVYTASLTESKADLTDNKSNLKTMNKFIHFLESDDRSQTLLANNKSQIPVYIFMNKDGEWEAHHPFHSIVWNPKTKKATYQYSDPIQNVENLWEIKQLKKDKELAAFINAAGAQCLIKMEFNSKKDYSAELINRSSNESKKIKIGG